MSPVTARALRRAALVTGALGATLIGHMLTLEGWRLLPIAPVLWLGVIAIAVLKPARHRRVVDFRAWGPVRILAALVAAQLAFHLLVEAAPWTVGLVMGEHDHGPVITLGAAVVHVCIALVLWTALCFGQRLLVRAVAVARALLAPERRRGVGGRPERIHFDGLAAPAGRRHRPRTSRGPPASPLRPVGTGRTLVAL